MFSFLYAGEVMGMTGRELSPLYEECLDPQENHCHSEQNDGYKSEFHFVSLQFERKYRKVTPIFCNM